MSAILLATVLVARSRGRPVDEGEGHVRNFGPVMATAATTTIVQVRHLVDVGDLDPENVVTPSIYVDRVVRVTGDAQEVPR